jgi:hypothetical protein
MRAIEPVQGALHGEQHLACTMRQTVHGLYQCAGGQGFEGLEQGHQIGQKTC